MNFLILKRTRVIIAFLFFVLTLFSFVDIYELLPESVISNILFIQFLPSLVKFIQVLSIGSLGFVIVILLTALMGRFYCSSICPLGIMQDVFNSIAKKFSRKKRFFKYNVSFVKTRFTILSLTVLGILFGISLVTVLFDPYSNAGRIFNYILKPIIVLGNNSFAVFMQEKGNFSFKIIESINTSIFIVIYSIVLLLIVAYFSYKRGRIICNVICPVGTLLGMISKKSVLKIQLDKNSCTKCGKCAGICKSECIDIKTQSIDYTRCVVCFNCLPVCNDNAINFSLTKSNKAPTILEKESKIDRRSALSALFVISASTSALAQNIYQSSLKTVAQNTGKLSFSLKKNPVSPPGSQSLKHFNSLCTACGLCISACPTNVLQPAIKEYGLFGLMQPHMDYVNAGFCNYDCNRCGNICPTGAILPLSIEDKKLTQIGKAVFVQSNCVVYRDETACGACSEHCPTKAVDMVPYKNGLVIPKVNQDICIGCGACEHPCPVDYPHKAIYVEGNQIHQVALKPKEQKSEYKEQEEDFPF